MKFLILLIILMFTSCSGQNHDLHDLQDLHDSDNVTDIDSQDETNDEKADVDADAEECLPSLMEAPFPYTDNDGNITFCRPNCDTPTEKDPQCMSNLWKEQNEALCTLHPAHDCCGYPCVNEYLKPVTKDELYKEYPEMENYVPMHKCDLFLSIWDNDGTHGVVKSWNMSDGKVGFKIAPVDLPIEKWPVKIKYVTYDIATQKYNFITPSRGQEQAYFKGNRIGLVADARSLELNNSNIFLAYIGDDGKRELVFNSKVNFLAYEPALNDKWAFVNLRETKSSPYKMMYAKVGEWKWTTLGESDGWFPSIVGDTFSFVDDDVNGWICDLTKSPQKLTDCLKFNEDGEQTEYLYFDKENETRLVFYSTFDKKIVLAVKRQLLFPSTTIIFTG